MKNFLSHEWRATKNSFRENPIISSLICIAILTVCACVLYILYEVLFNYNYEYLFTITGFLIFYIICLRDKISRLERKISNKNSHIEELEQENKKLKQELSEIKYKS